MNGDAAPRPLPNPIGEEEPRIHRSPFSGEPEVILRGVVQSVSPAEALGRPSYWAEMIPDAKPNRALILGFGAGTIAALLTQRFGRFPIVGVDLNPRMVETGYAVCDLAGADLSITIGDAFEYVATTRGRFDYIAVDIYIGGEIARGVFTKTFLRRLKTIAGPNGLITVNIIRTRRLDRQLARLREMFPTVDLSEAGFNIVAKCRVR